MAGAQTNRCSIHHSTALKAPLTVTPNTLIDGWYVGAEGMKLGGVREITIPSSLAWGDTMEICGGKNSPVKFIVMALETNEKIKELSDALDEIQTALYSAYSQAYSTYDYSDHADDSESETTSGE